ncbi:hypothetical protein AGMMS50256_38240 [Betaproteobacteria bacterium]|nr:hypothetical protein AGMMS50256_38240 [Betaproteobacteria bacterium]
MLRESACTVFGDWQDRHKQVSKETLITQYFVHTIRLIEIKFDPAKDILNIKDHGDQPALCQ